MNVCKPIHISRNDAFPFWIERAKRCNKCLEATRAKKLTGIQSSISFSIFNVILNLQCHFLFSISLSRCWCTQNKLNEWNMKDDPTLSALSKIVICFEGENKAQRAIDANSSDKRDEFILFHYHRCRRRGVQNVSVTLWCRSVPYVTLYSSIKSLY